MYCRNCGTQIDDDSAFCAACGTPCTKEQGATVIASETPEQARSEVTARNSVAKSYYAAEFAKIAEEKQTKFNWAAFFLGPFHQLYHGSTKLFQKTFLPYFIAVFAVSVAGQIAALFTVASFSAIALAVTGILSLLSVAVSVWGLVLAILNGKNYNKKLYEQVQGNAEIIPTRKKPALLLFIGYAGVLITVLTLISVLGGKMVADAWMGELQGDSDTYDSGTLFESEDDASAPVDVQADFLQLTDGVCISVDSPWGGSWVEEGYDSASTLYLMTTAYGVDPSFTENSDGSWSAYIYDSEEVYQGSLLLSSDYMTLEQSGSSGYEQKRIYQRPTLSMADSPLPPEYWGAYVPKTNDPQPVSHAIIIDAFAYGDMDYTAEALPDGGYQVEYRDRYHTFTTTLRLDKNGVLYDGDLPYEKIWSPDTTSVALDIDGQHTSNSGDLLDISSLPDLDSQEMALFSQCFWAKPETNNGFDGFALLGDDSMTLGELFGVVFDSYTWDDSYMIEQGTQATVYDAVCRLDGAQLRLQFSQLYTIIHPVQEGTIYWPDGTMQPLSQYDIARLMSALCDNYHQQTGTQSTSLAKDIQGTWVSSDGETELIIDSTTYGGDPYQIPYTTATLFNKLGEKSGDIPITITRSDGTIEERFLQLAGDSMTIYEVVPDGPGVQKGNVLGTYNRIV